MRFKEALKFNIRQTRNFWLSTVLVFLFSVTLLQPAKAGGGSLYLAPSRGSFLLGSTFSISIFIDTKGNEINALEVNLKFPPELLQITAPTTGESFISEWLTPPNYSNVGGFVSYKGGIPEGIITTAGLVSTVTFRAKSPGRAEIKFLDSSKILLKDGKGTPIFTNNFSGVYEILIPPPEGPKISSFTHPDSDVWYMNNNPVFSWEKEKGMTDFSFSISQNPQEIPDTISEGPDTSVFYRDIDDGIWYFHLRAQGNGIWGRASHFGVKIDTAPPKEFDPRIDLPSGFTYFSTKDINSGIDYYEISVLNISETEGPASFFVEALSPYKIPYQDPGKYSLVVRVYDKAGNLQIGEVKFRIFSSFISFIEGKGIQVKGILFPWWLVYLIVFILLFWMGLLIFYFVRKKPKFEKGLKEIKEALEEIEKIEEKEEKEKRSKEEFKKEKERLEERLR